ncbi:16S rRNA proCES [Forsythia ovata]|uniref:16S rRNA proCES n=1 Tax=Forsythia ovata TaxID=205694 RepID=A0ABD1S378_9LAMI
MVTRSITKVESPIVINEKVICLDTPSGARVSRSKSKNLSSTQLECEDSSPPVHQIFNPKRILKNQSRKNFHRIKIVIIFSRSLTIHFSSLANIRIRKTCNKKFPSFQALDGHRANHKKARMIGEQHSGELQTSPTKPKMHECPVCGLEFAIGYALLSRRQHVNSVAISSFASKLLLTSLHIYQSTHSALHSTATQEIVETSSSDSEFVEVGYISSVHGLRGEVRVKTSTDFPDLRFSKRGRRWLRQQVSGNESLQEIELVEGRGHPGQSWILKFNEIDTVEQAQKLVGSTMLVTKDDRPVLEEGEFYTHDLIGMTVVLKETCEPVGTVVEVFDSGASDLLRVRLHSMNDMPNQTGKSELEAGASGPLVWVPFVEAIVPNVDLEKREMFITPPKGLLELNIRHDERSKKERRELEWKERKKFQRRLIAAKKKLCEMEQQHVFHGFRYGEKDQRNLLANQIVTVNSKLLRQAMQNIETPSTRQNLLEILNAVPMTNTLKVSVNSVSAGSGEQSDPYSKLLGKGHLLTSQGKIATVLVLKEGKEIERSSNLSPVNSERNENACLLLKALLDDDQGFIKTEDRSSAPLILVCPAHSVGSLQDLFSAHNNFSFDSEKVWFLEEEKLPVVSSSLEGVNNHKILMKSPWEFLQTPVGSGGVISSLATQNLVEHLAEIGVEYVKVCNVNNKCENDHTLLGFIDSCKANVGIRLSKNMSFEEDFNLIFSINFMTRLVKQIDKLQFQAVLSLNSHVEKVEKDWIDVIPPVHNSYEFKCSIYGCLDACPLNKVCVLDAAK